MGPGRKGDGEGWKGGLGEQDWLSSAGVAPAGGGPCLGLLDTPREFVCKVTAGNHECFLISFFMSVSSFQQLFQLLFQPFSLSWFGQFCARDRMGSDASRQG